MAFVLILAGGKGTCGCPGKNPETRQSRTASVLGEWVFGRYNLATRHVSAPDCRLSTVKSRFETTLVPLSAIQKRNKEKTVRIVLLIPGEVKRKEMERHYESSCSIFRIETAPFKVHYSLNETKGRSGGSENEGRTMRTARQNTWSVILRNQFFTSRSVRYMPFSELQCSAGQSSYFCLMIMIFLTGIRLISSRFPIRVCHQTGSVLHFATAMMDFSS